MANDHHLTAIDHFDNLSDDLAFGIRDPREPNCKDKTLKGVIAQDRDVTAGYFNALFCIEQGACLRTITSDFLTEGKVPTCLPLSKRIGERFEVGGHERPFRWKCLDIDSNNADRFLGSVNG